jgi:hypothetical protein
MGKTKTIELSTEQRAALEKGYRKGHSHAFRMRLKVKRQKWGGNRF